VTENKSEATEASEVADAESTAVELDDVIDVPEDESAAEVPVDPPAKRSIDWPRVLAYGILPGLALVLALAAGFLKWQDNSVRYSDAARDESVRVAKDSTVALLSYQPDTVEQQLTDAQDLLTGQFRDSYTQLTTDVVIPGAKEQQISAVATVPAVASVSAEPNRAVVLLFVNQTVVVGADAPTDTASSVRVTLDRVGDRWLISGFEPV
jgi:Mce-associated membrane protein